MKENKWKKFARYYKPYLGSFAADMFFAILGAAVTLIIPMVVRYITGTVIYEEPDKAMSVQRYFADGKYRLIFTPHSTTSVKQ